MCDGTMPLKLDHARAWRTYIGGKMLDKWHGKGNSGEGEDTNFPEEWIASLVRARNAGREEFPDEGLSRIVDENGLPKEFLKDWIGQMGEKALGHDHWERFGASLGVLVKLIDAGERLTVQGHPDREMAKKLFHSEYGKTECWYVLGGRTVNGEPPCIYMGFKPGVTRKQWEKLFQEQNYAGMLECLHQIPVKKGEVILIEGGIPHAIGAGCFLTEIQEPTDYTIRVERVTPSGLAIADSMCHQGLGFERMFDCFHYDTYTEEELRQRWFLSHEPEILDEGTIERPLVTYEDTPYFKMEELTVGEKFSMDRPDTFSIVLVLEGNGSFSNFSGERMKVEKGDQILIPASVRHLILKNEGEQEFRMLQCFGPQIFV